MLFFSLFVVIFYILFIFFFDRGFFRSPTRFQRFRPGNGFLRQSIFPSSQGPPGGYQVDDLPPGLSRGRFCDENRIIRTLQPVVYRSSNSVRGRYCFFRFVFGPGLFLVLRGALANAVQKHSKYTTTVNTGSYVPSNLYSIDLVIMQEGVSVFFPGFFFSYGEQPYGSFASALQCFRP